MCKPKTLKDNLTEFLDVVDDFCGLTEEQYDYFWECVDFDCLYQTLCRLSAKVYEYQAGMESEQIVQYRGERLFPCEAIQIYKKPNLSVNVEELDMTHSTEVWLLEDLTLAVTSCFTVEVGGTGYTTTYRAYKGAEWPINEDFDMDIFCACLKLASSGPMVMGAVPLFEG